MSKFSFWIFLGIAVAGLFLRFYNIERLVAFGWDQARDAWIVRDILNGKLILAGPKTGIGQFHIGPLHYYLLVPFYFLLGGDPTAANYLNIFYNAFNFVAVYWVIKKVFSSSWAVFASAVLAYGAYAISLNRIPWNVTPLLGLSMLAYYSLFRIAVGERKYIFILVFLVGLLFQVHFTVVIFLFILPPLLIIFRHYRRNIKYFIYAIPMIFIILLPNIIYDLVGYHDDFYKYRDFLRDYFIGFHLRFLLFRLPDILIQFQTIFSTENFKFMKIVIPVLFTALAIFEKDNKRKKMLVLSFLWLGSTLFTFTIYGGTVSDYYFMITYPVVIVAIIYIQKKLLVINKLIAIPIFVFWFFVISDNFRTISTSSSNGGLLLQKQEVIKSIRGGQKIEYNEGYIKAYLYMSWVEDKKRFK